MSKSKNYSIRTKTIFLVLSVLVMFGVGGELFINHLQKSAVEDAKKVALSFALQLEGAVEAQFYERYGDAQAFALNPVMASGDKARITEYLNNYAILYGIYDLIMLVDQNGNLVATNTKAPDGRDIPTQSLVGKSYKNEEWFKNTLSGKFSEDKAKNLGGTFVQSAIIDEDVKAALGGDGYVSTFSAQVKNAEGKVIGVLSNRAGARWFEFDFVNIYSNIRQLGYTKAVLNLLDKNGTVIVQHDPVTHENSESVFRDFNILLKTNLTENGLEAARKLVAGEKGSFQGHDAQNDRSIVGGYSAMRSSKIVDSLGWGAMVRLDESEVLAPTVRLGYYFQLTLVVLTILGIVGSVVMSTFLMKQIQSVLSRLTAESESASQNGANYRSISRTLSEGVNEEAASVQETASSLDELTSMVKKTADNAGRSHELAQTSQESVSAGQGAVDSMVTSIKDIAENNKAIMQEVERNNQEIRDIVKVISEIGNKTKIINDIVFQTKLLSFNASVEAARAGEHGKGFAVVADEVGKLAQISGNSAKEITDMLSSSIQKVEDIVKRTTQRVGNLITEGARKVEQGAELSEKCRDSFVKIKNTVDGLVTMVDEISSASTEQSAGISEINKAINNLNKVTQKNNDMASRVSEASERVNSQSRSLQSIVVDLRTVVLGGAGVGGPVQAVDEIKPPTQMTKGPEVRTQVKPKFEKPKPSLKAFETHASVAVKAAAGSDIPMHNDPRFEDV